MTDLTLEECLKQDRGYQGRLFEVDENKLGIGEKSIHLYRVLDYKDATMNIKGYLRGRGVQRLDNVPVDDERKQDVVMNSKRLMDWYRMAGLAGKAGLFLND